MIASGPNTTLSPRVIAGAAVAAICGPLLLGAMVRWSGVQPQAVWSLVRDADPLAVAVILGGTGLQMLVAAEKWRLVEGQLAGRWPSRRRAASYSLVGLAASQFLPAPLAAALVRGGGNHLHAGQGGWRGAITSIWEQMFDFGILGLLSLPAAISLAFRDPRCFLVGAPILLVTADRIVGPVIAWLGPRLRLPAPLAAKHLTVALFRWSVARYLLLTGVTFAVAWAARSNISFVALAATIPPVGVATVVSFLPSGLGVNEWGYVLALGAFGIASGAAGAFSLVNRVLVSGSALMLGVFGAILMGMDEKR